MENKGQMIIAGIVTYNPAISDMKKSLPVLMKQVSKLIVVDNGSDNIQEIRDILSSFDECTIVSNSTNLGIAAALNQIFVQAESSCAEWVLTLDDDSIVPANMVAQYREVLQSGAAGTGMLCPMLMDRVSGSLTHSKMSADECITSGSLTNVSVWRAIGGFDDWLFIDGVDFDFSRRLVKAKWDIVECPQVIMAHEIGTTRVHSFCGHKIQIMNHSPLRKFYQERNYPYIDYKLGTHSYPRELGRLCKHLWMVLLFETQKFAKMRAMLRGRADAYKKIAQMKRNGI